MDDSKADSDTAVEIPPEPSLKNAATERFDGVVIGVLAGIDEGGSPLVAFPGNPKPIAVVARSTAALSGDHIGREVALLFEDGNPTRPLVIGPIQRPNESQHQGPQVTAELDGERLVLNADREIVLRCGKASITLTRAGKVLIRGTYLLSRSSGVNRIKGGSVQLN
jgi:hypothetical protein